jgi:hypothetical protein
MTDSSRKSSGAPGSRSTSKRPASALTLFDETVGGPMEDWRVTVRLSQRQDLSITVIATQHTRPAHPDGPFVRTRIRTAGDLIAAIDAALETVYLRPGSDAEVAEMIRATLPRVKKWNAAVATALQAGLDGEEGATWRPRKRAAAGRPAPGPKRRYLVCGLEYWMNFSGKVNPIGCSSLQSAERAFARRAAETERGAIVLYDRETQRILWWTEDVKDPVQAARYWFGAR